MGMKQQQIVENKGEGWEPWGAGLSGAAGWPGPSYALQTLRWKKPFHLPHLNPAPPPPTPPIRERRQCVPGTGWGGLSWKHQINVNRKTFYVFSPLEQELQDSIIDEPDLRHSGGEGGHARQQLLKQESLGRSGPAGEIGVSPQTWEIIQWFSHTGNPLDVAI